MQQAQADHNPDHKPDHDNQERQPEAVEPPPAALLTLAERLNRTIAVARALLIAGRMVDLAGVEDAIGMLCAKTLDLAPRQARLMLPALLDMRAQIDSLMAAMRRPARP
jgi:hypothetical protein